MRVNERYFMEYIAERVKSFRVRKGLSQRELSIGICDESTIFRLEKSKILPRLDILKLICEKLEIPLSVLVFQYDDEILRLRKLCRELTYFEDYSALEVTLEYLQAIEEKDIELNKFIQWHHSIILHKHKNKGCKSLGILLKIVPDNLPQNETDIGILNSISIVYIHLKDFESALIYLKNAYNNLDLITFTYDFTALPRVKYNYAYCLYYLGNIDYCMSICLESLNYLKNNNLNYYLGEFHFILGNIYKQKGEFENSKNSFIKALTAFSLDDDYDKMAITEKKIQSIKICNDTL